MADNTQKCVQCHSTIPPNQPPVFNTENCSCVEDGAGEGVSQPPLIEQPTYFFETANNRHPYAQQPRSGPSPPLSVTCPEGPEREYPQIQALSSYLPLRPSPGEGYALALSGLEDFNIADSDARSRLTTNSVVESGKEIYDHSNDHQSGCGIIEETPSNPGVGPGENNSYTLPQAWMTRSEDETRGFLLPEQTPNTVGRTKLSIIALSTAAILLRRWIRSSRRQKEEITLISPTDITEAQALSVSDHPTRSLVRCVLTTSSPMTVWINPLL